MAHLSISAQKRARPAQSLVEFALTAPLLVAIVIGVIELGILFSLYIGLANSARETARAGAIYQYPGATPNTAEVSEVNTIDADRALFMSDTLTATLSPIIAADTVTVTVSYLPAPGAAYQQPAGALTPLDPQNPLRSGDTVSVTLEHSHRLLWGLLGPRDLVLRSTSAARLEPGGAQ